MELSSATIKCCASCGKEEGEDINLKACVACKLVKYCNRECQIAHRPQHKKACKKRAAELHDGALFKDPPPPEDCPICCLPLPGTEETMFRACCGKVICDGCCFAAMEGDCERGKKQEDIGMCPFCRMPPVHLDEEEVARVKKVMERGNADAYSQLALCYSTVSNGVPQDYTKANELYLKAGELGDAVAYYNLGQSYKNGLNVDRDDQKAKYFYELAAMRGEVNARYNLGMIEGRAGNHGRAMKHLLIAAKSGNKLSLDKVKDGFGAGLVAKDEYEQALRAYHERQVEAKSEARDKAVKYRERLAALRRG